MAMQTGLWLFGKKISILVGAENLGWSLMRNGGFSKTFCQLTATKKLDEAWISNTISASQIENSDGKLDEKIPKLVDNEGSGHKFDETTLSVMFEEWKASFCRRYKDAVEEEQRFKIFKDSVELVYNHNKSNESWKLGLSEFADQTRDDFMPCGCDF